METVPAWLGYEHGTTACWRRGCPCTDCSWSQWLRLQQLPPTLGPAERKRQHIPAAIRTEVYERDGWTCQLCMSPVEPTAGLASPWRPSLDHIVPHSKGGPDTIENLRTAHRWCNTVRGADDRHADLFMQSA